MTVCILQGDAREVLRELPTGSVHCVVTSPPYWGLRDYGVDGQIGVEADPWAYVAELVQIFREIRRVLRDDGTVWLNLGDCYASGGGADGDYRPGKMPPNVGLAATADRHNPRLNPRGPTRDELGEVPRPLRAVRDGSHAGKHTGMAARGPMVQANRVALPGLKPGDLVGLPWMVAFALRDDGWWLRQDNIWAKRNGMPESIRNRTTRAHEYVFHLTKSGDPLFWTHRTLPGVRRRPKPDFRWLDRANNNAETDQEPDGWRKELLVVGKRERKRWLRVNLWEGQDYFYDATAIEEDGEYPAGTRAAKGTAERSGKYGVSGRPPEYAVYSGKRNKRSVWRIATQPFPEAHFATMPADLVEVALLAGTSARGCCRRCGAPWWRLTAPTERYARALGESWHDHARDAEEGRQQVRGENRQNRGRDQEGVSWREHVTTGWVPTCACDAGAPVPCVVLDPFGGAGTTALVADRHGRDAVLVELNPEYCAMVERRLRKDAPLLADVAAQ